MFSPKVARIVRPAESHLHDMAGGVRSRITADGAYAVVALNDEV